MSPIHFLLHSSWLPAAQELTGPMFKSASCTTSGHDDNHLAVTHHSGFPALQADPKPVNQVSGASFITDLYWMRGVSMYDTNQHKYHVFNNIQFSCFSLCCGCGRLLIRRVEQNHFTHFVQSLSAKQGCVL